MKTCPICGEEFEGGRKYCPPPRQCAAEANRRNARQRYENHKVKLRARQLRYYHEVYRPYLVRVGLLSSGKRRKIKHANPIIWTLAQIRSSSPDKLAAAMSDPRGFRVAGGTR